MKDVNRGEAGERMVFVGGAPRSGTTLLQNMLDSHPDIFGGPELMHLQAIMRLRDQLLITDRNGWTREFYTSDGVDRMIGNMVEELLLPLADRHDARLIAEKTPVNVLVFEDLLALLPGSRCIHIVRDPRAVVASMLRAGKRLRGTELERTAPRDAEVRAFTTSVRTAIAYVQRCHRAGLAAAEAAPDRLLTVHYERLVSDPAGETRRLCAFLDVPWSEAMLRPADSRHAGETQMTAGFGGYFHDAASFRRNPDLKAATRWRTDLTRLQKATIVSSYLDFDERDRLPYDLSPQTLGAPDRLAMSALRLMRGAKRGLRRGARGAAGLGSWLMTACLPLGSI